MTKSCEKKLIKLYSSINLSNSSDTKVFGKWDIDSKLKVLTHMTGEYSKNGQPNIYFKAKVTLDAVVSKLGVVSKSNIVVKDICFKNEFNVSASSRTDEYKYLYNISCSSADNASSSSSYCSSELSLSDIIANGIEKQIMDNVKAFIVSDAFKITWVLEKGSFTLNTTKYDPNNVVVFPNIKMTIKYKLINSTSSSCSSSSSSSSSCKSHKPKHFIKMLIMGFVAVLVIMFLFKFLKNNNNCSNGYDGVLSKGNVLIKSFFPSNEGYEPKPTPYKPKPIEHVNEDNQDA